MKPVFRFCRLLPVALLLPAAVEISAQTRNGFDVANASIDIEEIRSGGPPRDGIPSIDRPKFIAPADADFMRDDDVVIALTRGETARAYPLRILVWHEIVNDTIGGEAVAVTYCPLCGTAMAFDRRVRGKVRTLGVSGLLYQSDVLMYDRESESLWTQLGMKAVSGPEEGATLTWLPSEHLTWKAWREKHPDGEVLSTDTGFRRNYGGNAYAAYFASDKTMFPVPKTRRELPEKDWVIGIMRNGRAKAYPVKGLPADAAVTDTVGGDPVTLRYDAGKKRHFAAGKDGGQIPSVMVYWFAWQAFYPETELWTPAAEEK